jgi:hypothetical protein
MNRYTIEHNGQRFVIEAESPDQALSFAQQQGQPQAPQDPIRATVQQEISDLQARGVDTSPGLPRQFLQGATFGAADEILAGAMTPLEMIRRGTLDPREAYKYAKAREDLTLEQQRESSGMGGTAMEIAGGAGAGMGISKAIQAAPQAASAVGRFAQNALGGARAGTGAGARIGSSVSGGAAYGGVTGFNEGSGEGRLTGARDGAAIGAAAGGLLQGGVELGKRMFSFVPAMIDPSGYAARQVARGVSESGRSPSAITREVQTAARQGQPFTVADAMGNAGQRQLSVVARNPGAGRTQVNEFLSARQAGQGRRLANNLSEGLDAPITAAQSRAQQEAARKAAGNQSYGAARDQAGMVDPTGAIRVADDFLAPGRAGNIVQSPLPDDSVESVVRRFRSRMTDGDSFLTDFNAAHRLKIDLDTAIEGARGQAKGVLVQMRNSLDDSLASASAPYAQARNQYRTQSKAIDAIDTGRNMAMRGRTEDTIPAFRAMSQPEQASARIGYADPIIERMQGGAPGVNKAREFMSDAVQSELHAIAPLKSGKPMMDRFARENTMFETMAQALGGSRTADNLADSAATGVDPAILGNLLSGNLGAAARNTLVRSADNLGGNTPAVREQMAKILLQTGNDPQLQQTLSRAMQSDESMRVLLGALLRGGMGGTAAGTGALQGQRSR